MASIVRRIRPAGWVVIALFVGGLGYLAVSRGWPLVQRLLDRSEKPAPPAMESPAPETPVETPTPEGAVVLPRSLFGPPPAQAPAEPVSVAVVPGLVGSLDGVQRVEAASEAEALGRVMAGEAAAAVVGVPALAATPELMRRGLRATDWAGDASAPLAPSCDAEALRTGRLGAVRGSTGHYHLLAALAGEPLPEIALFDRAADLQRARSEGAVTAGPVQTEGCYALARAALPLVVVHRADRPLTKGQRAAIAQAMGRDGSGIEAAAFFDPARKAPGGFRDTFESASEVWRRVGLVTDSLSWREAADFSIEATEAPRMTSPDGAELGYPSSADF